MGKRGPAPKNTEQRKLEGNPARRPLNHAEPKFEGGADMPPEVKLDPIARAEWKWRAPELEQKRVLTRQDQTEFAEYCLQHSTCVNLWKQIKKVGYELAIAKGLLKARFTASSRRSQIAAKFGFTPSDRTQVKVPDQTPPANGAGRFLTVVK